MDWACVQRCNEKGKVNKQMKGQTSQRNVAKTANNSYARLSRRVSVRMVGLKNLSNESVRIY